MLMQGYKRAKVETGEGVALVKTEGVDADMNISQYRRGDDVTTKQPPIKTAVGRKRHDYTPHPAPGTNEQKRESHPSPGRTI